MKMQLTKGPTITPQMFPISTVAGAEPTLVGFSGMSELDYVATHLCAALIQRYDPTQTDVVSLSVDTAEKLLLKSESIRQVRATQQLQQQQQQQQQIDNDSGQIIDPGL